MVARGEPSITAEDAPRLVAPAEEVLPDDPRRPARAPLPWSGAFLSLLLHAAIIVALLGLWRLPPPHEVVLQVALVQEGPGAAGAAGGADGKAAISTDGTAASGSTAPAPSAASPEPSVTAPAPPQPAPPQKAPLAPAAAVSPSTPAPPRPQRKPQPPHHPAAPVTAAAEPPAPAPSPAAASRKPADAATTAAAAGVGQGPAGPSGAGKGVEGQGHGVVGNGPIEGPGDDYLDRVRRWLAKYKKYPEEALKKKIEGEVVVDFTLARDGTVLAARVEKSSGSALLDDAAVRMLHDASPVPPVPDRYKGSELRISMPVGYSIGFFERLFR